MAPKKSNVGVLRNKLRRETKAKYNARISEAKSRAAHARAMATLFRSFRNVVRSELPKVDRQGLSRAIGKGEKAHIPRVFADGDFRAQTKREKIRHHPV